MRPLPLKLGPGSDLRRSLEQLAIEQGASGFVLGVVGNLSRATFQCAGRSGPTVLEGDLEIITLQGTVAPQGVHLHLSLSDGDCQVWGGHLEPGTLVLKGADLLVGFLPTALLANVTPRAEAHGPSQNAAQLRVEVAVLSGCPWSKRALRMLRTLGIPHQVQTIATDAERRQLEQRSGQSTLPQVFIDGQLIGGYDDLAELQGRGGLDRLRSS
jgi:predicted DNA-binding protein with PD1-like motif/glutaredoxin